MPDFLGQERHDRVTQAQVVIQGIKQALGHAFLLVGVLAHIKDRLDQLQVPVTQLVPEELVKTAGGLLEVIAFDGGAHFAGKLGDPGEQPAVGQRGGLGLVGGLRVFGQRQRQAHGVPNLVAEVAALFVAFFRMAHVLGLGGLAHEREAGAVGPILLDQFQGVDAGALGFGHALAVTGHNGGVNVHVGVGFLSQELITQHNHASHPQVDNVTGGHQHVGGIEVVQVFALVRPAEHRKRP